MTGSPRRHSALSRVLGCALAALTALGCAAQTDPPLGRGASPIHNAEGISSNPAVGALVIRRSACDERPVEAYCTATLIDERAVLTAGHCVDGFPADQLELYFGSAATDAAGFYRGVVATRIHPRYADDSSDNDVALAWLDAPVTAAPPQLMRSGMDDSWIGKQVEVIGFGDTKGASEEMTRQRGTVLITSVDAHKFRYSPDPSMTCQGDSGGPAFASVNGVNYLVGVTSAGDLGCTTYGEDTRVDGVLEFLDGELAKGPPSRSGAIAAPDTCTAICETDEECPTGLVCDFDAEGVGRCTVRGNPPAVYDGVCGRGSDCESGTCVPLGASCACYKLCDGSPNAEPEPDAGVSADAATKAEAGAPPPYSDGGDDDYGCALRSGGSAKWSYGALLGALIGLAASTRRRTTRAS